MTEEQIERIVCSKVGIPDREFLSTQMLQKEYYGKLRAIDTWGDKQRKLIGLSPIVTCGINF